MAELLYFTKSRNTGNAYGPMSAADRTNQVARGYIEIDKDEAEEIRAEKAREAEQAGQAAADGGRQPEVTPPPTSAPEPTPTDGQAGEQSSAPSAGSSSAQVRQPRPNRQQSVVAPTSGEQQDGARG